MYCKVKFWIRLNLHFGRQTLYFDPNIHILRYTPISCAKGITKQKFLSNSVHPLPYNLTSDENQYYFPQ